MAEPITIRIPRPVAYATIGLVLVATVLTLGSLLNRGPGAAHDRADRYLTALVAGDTHQAWGLLSGRVQTIWGSFENFDSAVRAADWTSFEFEIMQTSCDDNVCGVDLSLPNGPDSVPRMLYQGPTHYWWGPADSLVFSDQFVTGGKPFEPAPEGDIDARIVVLFGFFPWDETGVA